MEMIYENISEIIKKIIYSLLILIFNLFLLVLIFEIPKVSNLEVNETELGERIYCFHKLQCAQKVWPVFFI